MTQPSLFDKLFRAVRIFFALTTAAALGVYAYIGTLIRPIGDDYCISARLIGYNVFQAAVYKYWFTSNRFSNQFVAAFTDLFGPRGVAVFAVGCLVLWLIGLMWLLYEAAQWFHLSWDFWTAFLLAELVALVSYYTAANLFQSVYWRPGVMTYYFPLVAYAFIVAGILRGSRVANQRPERSREAAQLKGRPSLWAITFLFFSAFFTGGLSETVGALYISLLGLALVLDFIWNKGATRRASLALITATLTGALLAMVGMFITPANAIRLNGTASPSLLSAIAHAFIFALQFLAEDVRLLKQPALFALASGALIGFGSVKFFGEEAPAPRKIWIALVVVPVLTYLLTAASFAPSAYGQSYPVERVRFPAYTLLAMSLLLEGGLIGILLAGWQRTLPRWALALPVLALFVGSLYPLWVARHVAADVPLYATNARQWDQRDARIRELAASGEKNIIVWQLPGLANVKEMDSNPKQWVNYCAAIYYDVATIRAPQVPIPNP